MSSPDWTTFAGVALLVTALVVALARASAGLVTDQVRASGRVAPLDPSELLVNVALTQGVFGAAVAGAAWYARVPRSALGVDASALTPRAVGLGLAAGLLLAAANEGAARVSERVGVRFSEALRELLAPDTPAGWVVLLGVALPVVAGFEELLFRGALVGALAAGFGVSPWLLAVASSVAFGLAHGAQGRAGMVVAGVLGLCLSAAYLWTGSLLAAAVAHYVVNALEFVLHEGPVGA